MIILLIAIIIIIVTIIIMYNRLIMLNIRCKNGWSQIDNQLKRRYDLIPNLVEVTKGYAKHESETLVNITKIRNESIKEKALETKEISDKITKLLFVAEAYPDLLASDVFKKLQTELSGTEDKIAYARQFYNDSVQQYNTAIEQFPSNILAKIGKFNSKEYFQIDNFEKKNVEIKI
ncbi:MAG: LemA family protein [Bacilli bacterium]